MRNFTFGRMLRLNFTVIAGVLGVMAAMAFPVHAMVASAVPEIDGASLSAGVGLVAGSVLMSRARRRSKEPAGTSLGAPPGAVPTDRAS